MRTLHLHNQYAAVGQQIIFILNLVEATKHIHAHTTAILKFETSWQEGGGRIKGEEAMKMAAALIPILNKQYIFWSKADNFIVFAVNYKRFYGR